VVERKSGDESPHSKRGCDNELLGLARPSLLETGVGREGVGFQLLFGGFGFSRGFVRFRSRRSFS
jgi:hypothetical protein